MTIELYTGTPGSGKSLDACRLLRRHLRRGGKAIVNFEVNTDESCKGSVDYIPNNVLTPGILIARAADYWSSRPFKQDGILVIVDEAQLLWNSRLWSKDPYRMQWLELLSQSRKHGLHMVLVCQADIMIDRQFRSLVEYEVKHLKIGNIGTIGMFLRLFTFGELFYAKKFYYGEKVKVDGYFFRYSKKIGSMYDTLTTFAQLSTGTAQAVTVPAEQI